MHEETNGSLRHKCSSILQLAQLCAEKTPSHKSHAIRREGLASNVGKRPDGARSSQDGARRCRLETPHVSLLCLRCVFLFFGSSLPIALVASILAWACANELQSTTCVIRDCSEHRQVAGAFAQGLRVNEPRPSWLLQTRCRSRQWPWTARRPKSPAKSGVHAESILWIS